MVLHFVIGIEHAMGGVLSFYITSTHSTIVLQ
jgi:hypothetical protein